MFTDIPDRFRSGGTVVLYRGFWYNDFNMVILDGLAVLIGLKKCLKPFLFLLLKKWVSLGAEKKIFSGVS